MIYPPGTVLIEKDRADADGPLRAVMTTDCPPMFTGVDYFDLRDRQWGLYLEGGHWSGPWHCTPKRLEPHPDPDSIWEAWADYCAALLINQVSEGE